GGFVSQSLVTLWPSFAMQTAVHFTFTHVDEITATPAGEFTAAASGSSQHGGDTSNVSLPSQANSLKNEHSHDTLNRFEDNKTAVNPARSESVDHAFGEEIDWRLEHLVEHAAP